MDAMRVTPVLLLATVALAACGRGSSAGFTTAPTTAGSTTSAPTTGGSAVTVTSTDLTDGQPVPRRFTCDGDNVSPSLQWTGVPDDAASVAVVVDDPDAPSGTFVHWVLWGIDPDTTSIESGAVPDGARQARNSAGHAAYDGPCPPGTSTHHYRFTVYALGDTPTAADGAPAADVLPAIQQAARAQGRLVGTYHR